MGVHSKYEKLLEPGRIGPVKTRNRILKSGAGMLMWHENDLHMREEVKAFYEGLARGGHQVLNEVVLNQVLVSFGSPERTREVIARVQADGTCWCGGTVWQGHTAMRVSVSSWATREADVERSLAAILRAADF